MTVDGTARVRGPSQPGGERVLLLEAAGERILIFRARHDIVDFGEHFRIAPLLAVLQRHHLGMVDDKGGNCF